MTTFSGLFAGSSGSGIYTTPHLGYKSGKYYSACPALDTSTSDQQTLTTGSIYYTPFYVHSDIAISALTFANGGTGDNGKNVRVGVYANDQGAPGSLVVAASPVTLTAAIAAREVAVSASLSKAWYWFALQMDSGGSIRNVATPPAGYGYSFYSLASPPSSITTGAAALSVTGSYGALASTAVTPTAAGFILLCGFKVA